MPHSRCGMPRYDGSTHRRDLVPPAADQTTALPTIDDRVHRGEPSCRPTTPKALSNHKSFTVMILHVFWMLSRRMSVRDRVTPRGRCHAHRAVSDREPSGCYPITPRQPLPAGSSTHSRVESRFLPLRTGRLVVPQGPPAIHSAVHPPDGRARSATAAAEGTRFPLGSEST